MADFTIIKNPQNYFLKFEVWYKGQAETADEKGYRVVKEVCKPIKAFRTQKEASEYINYEVSVRSFQKNSQV